MVAGGGFADTLNGGNNSYVSLRTPSSWVTKGVTPPLMIERPDPGSSAVASAFSADMSRALLTQGASRVVSGGPEGSRRALFLRDVQDGSLRWITAPTTSSPTGDPEFRLAGVSPGLEHIILDAIPQIPSLGTVRLVDADQQRNRGTGLYNYTEGELRPIGVLPDGTIPVDGAVSPSKAFNAELTWKSANNQVSRDGSRVVFVSPDPAVAANFEPRQLYLRIGGRTTQLISRSMLTGARASSGATFEFASPDGTKIWFQTSAQLTADAVAPGQKRYVFDSATETVEYVEATGGEEVGAPLVSSDDGTRYLYTRLGTNELWMNDGGVHTTVAAPVDLSLEGLGRTSKFVRATSDGARIVFVTSNEVNPGAFNNRSGEPQVYLYETDARRLSCISCPSDPSVPAGRSAVLGGDPFGKLQGERVISDDGRRIAFQTAAPLVPRDVNGRMDVYLWEDGEISLISAGTGPFDSRVGDMNSDGSTVFFMTRDRLVPEDIDGSVDVYAARVGGGFPRPVTPPQCDQACQAPPTAPPALPAPGTDRVDGGGNLDEQPAPRAQVFVSKPGAAAVRRFARTGRLRLSVRSTMAGHLSAVTSARTGRRWYVASSGGRTLRGAARTDLAVTLSARARRQLAERGVLRVRVRLTHSAGGNARQLTFVLKASRSRGARSTGSSR